MFSIFDTIHLAIDEISKPQLQCLHFDFIGNIVEDL